MSIDITIEEMEALPAESYELFDIRGEIERAHGILPNSTASSADVLMENPPEDKEKKIIICCSRGQISRDIAEELQEQGYEAYSLKGGYVGWLMADMKKKEADDVCEHVELSIRKKFKRRSGPNLQKLSENMNWSKKVTGSQYVFPVEKIQC